MYDLFSADTADGIVSTETEEGAFGSFKDESIFPF